MSGPARTLQQAELTVEEVQRILKVCGPQALLVGGQALATWSAYYGVQPAGGAFLCGNDGRRLHRFE
jgi:hypothetical protein